MYTRDIIILSNQLESYAKIKSSQTSVGSINIISKFGLDGAIDPQYIRVQSPHLRWVNWRREIDLTNIDITLRDEWNDLLYIPNYNDTESNQDWEITIIAES